MLELLEDLPEGVLGVRASGEVTADDYRTVLVPAIEEKLAKYRRLRFIYVFDTAFSAFSAAAAWEDAKVGLHHFTQFERVAVVGDHDAINRMVRAFGFLLPGEVRVFGLDELPDAESWIAEPPPRGKLEFRLFRDQRVLVLEPRDELEAVDFERVAAEVDPFVEAAGPLAGIVIVAERFPGWDDFAAFAAHLRFVREHRDKVQRIALVTRSHFLAAMPRLAALFVDAEVRRFAMDERDAALAWATDAL